ncbi:MAG: hypothetical protein E6Q58_00630 [Niabella sp.]|nr:MAG: hypothetical protein E6Q58_00630 [Niabella sp.]
MEEKIRVGIVSYLNSRPLIYGLERLPIKDKIELIEAHPALLADKLIQNEIDLGLIPVAVIPLLKSSFVNGKYCIGAIGDVASVALFCHQPIEKIKRIFLDYQSRTSVQLLKWLVKNYWHISPEFIETKDETYIGQIKDETAALIIGDRALEQRANYAYVYDLAGEWKTATGLPFVFAAWVSTKKLSQDFIDCFDEANAFGLQHIEAIANEHHNGIYDLNKYFSVNLSYALDEDKLKGLNQFLQEME